MNIAIFYDTETTGLPLFDQPSDDPRQPHLVQLAAALVDLDTRETLSSLDVIIRPDGWTIPEEVSAIHGITTEKAQDLGVSEGNAVDMFLAMWNQRLRIAHNEQFDARILRIAIKRFIDIDHPDLVEPPSDMWKTSSADCTAKRATPIVKCPPTARMVAVGRNHYKTPNLGEAYQFFTGQPLEGAHNAMVDVKACIAVHFGIQDHLAQ